MLHWPSHHAQLLATMSMSACLTKLACTSNPPHVPAMVYADSLVSLQLQHSGNDQPAEQPWSHLALSRGSVQLMHNIPKWDNGLGLAASFILRQCCRCVCEAG